MVTFVSLFLWLITGVHPVEVAVDSQVVRVEILLDGELVKTMNGAPWKTKIDFGALLEPQELTAVAYAENNREVGRARQVINLPRPEAEARIALNRGDDGQPVSVRVVIQSAGNLEPLSIMTTFDGHVLTLDKSGQYLLPKHDPTAIHIVSTEASYANGVVARSDIGVGGTFGQIVVSELTAVPVKTTGDPPSTASLRGRLTIDGEKLRVAAVEHSGARIYVVRDLASTNALKSAGMSNVRPFRSVRTKRDPIIELDLGPEIDRVHLVGANPIAARGTSLFPVTGAVSLKRWSLPWAVTTLFDRYTSADEQRLADAVAVAGIRAAAHGSPRAVILVLSENPVDGSGYSNRAVRHYLEKLRVPLHVWVTGKKTATVWGPATKTLSNRDFTQASKTLLQDLEQQWVIWVEGSHLAHRIDLDGADLGLTLVGAPTTK